MSVTIEKDEFNQNHLVIEDRLGVCQAKEVLSAFYIQKLMLDLHKTLSGVQRMRIIDILQKYEDI